MVLKVNEEADYAVTITIRLTTRVAFAPAERDRRITSVDAVANAVGQMPEEVWEQIENGFGGEYVPEITFEVMEV